VEKGAVKLQGRNVTNRSPRAIRSAGLAHIPEDRNLRGLNRKASISENLAAAQIDGKKFAPGGILKKRAILENAFALAKRYDIRPPEPLLPASSLSGGNAQKVVVAREVEIGAKLLIASQPTRGVDIGAIESIEAILEKVKSEGVGVLLVSADLREILSLSDRILVMFEGRITGEMAAGQATEDKLGLLMMGGADEAERKEAMA
jgi:simple sugar transport system ATP-binding protein